MRAVVFGAGAIGGLFGARLARARHDVLLVAREADVAEIRLHGLRVEGAESFEAPVAVVDALTDGMQTDALLLCVKSPDVEGAGREIARRIRPLPPLLALQNGLGIEALLRAGLAAGGAEPASIRIVRAINSVPSTRLGPGRVRAAGTGEVLLPVEAEDASGAAGLFEALLTSAKIPVRRVPALEKEVWRKLLVNAAINPVTADHGIPNGQLARDPWRGQAEELLREALAVARAEGFDLSEEEAEAELWKIVRATAPNRSSMLQDVERGHRTEIDAIAGEVLRRGAAHGLALPATRRAMERIRAREPARAGPTGGPAPQPR
jgi:2-dehydropantoate 2-reductase